MADINIELEKLAEEISAKVELGQEEISKGLLELTKGKTAEEASAILAEVNINGLMRNKLSNVFAIYRSGIIRILEETYTTSLLSEATLNNLALDAERFLASEFIDKTTPIIRQGIMKGIATDKFPNQTLKEVKDSLLDLGLSDKQMRTLINTSYNQYSNSVTNMMAADLPKNTKYIYIGANDSKTRQECKDKINDSPATKLYILNKYGNLDNEIWNCRHKWVQMGRDKEAQGFEEASNA